MSNQEILAEEFEVLQSIFLEEELEIISDSHLKILIEPEASSSSAQSFTIKLDIRYPLEYPEIPPILMFESVAGGEELSEEEEEELQREMKTLAEESQGEPVTFTLASQLKESLSQLLITRAQKEKEAADERYRKEEEAAAARLAGTKVTPESFLTWKAEFLVQMKERKEKEDVDRIKGLSPKEREEVKKVKARLSGKQLFSLRPELYKDDALDASLIEEGTTEVDLSQYDREARDAARREEEEEREKVESVEEGWRSDDD